MPWEQQYGRFCRDCEYWDGMPYTSRKTKVFKGLEGTCHRYPASHFNDKIGRWEKPTTLDTEGCGEFKLITYLDDKMPAETELTVNSAKTVNVEQVSDTLMDIKQTAKLLNVSTSRIYSMRSSGQIPLAIRLGKTIRWNKKELVEWIQEGCPPLQKWLILKKHRKY